MESIIVFRAIERIIAIAVGAMCIYLGYRLFSRIPEEKQGEAKIKFPGDVSIYIARVGPGVFFALFGAVIIGLSFYLKVEYVHQSSQKPTAMEAQPTASGTLDSEVDYFRGLTPTHPKQDFASLEKDRLRLILEIEYLNSLSEQINGHFTEHQIIELNTRTAKIKLAIMKTIWASDWGDFDEFQLWVEAGADDPIPAGLEFSAEYFRSGSFAP